MMIIITVTFVITNEIHFWTLLVHTITIANTRGWSPLIFNMATILTKQVKDVHLLHNSGHTPARDTSFFSAICEENWQSICLFWKLANWYPSPPSLGTNLGKINWKKPDVQPLFKFIQLGTRAWWTRVLYKVLEPTKLGYQSGYFEKRLMNQPSFQFIYPD